MRIGHGYDAHKFGEPEAGAKLVLGGVEISHDKKLLAHSDGDVVLHALCDALLGAAALGDIGRHFPDSSEEFKNISSRVLLQRVVAEVKKKQFIVENADITIVAQAPKMAPHVSAMVKNISDDLDIRVDRINVKATTTEGMGFTGRGEGIAVYAVVLISHNS